MKKTATLTFEQIASYLPYRIKASVPAIKTSDPDVILTLTKLCKDKCYFNILNGYSIHLYQNVKLILKPLSEQTLMELFKDFKDFEIIFFNDTGIKIQYKILDEWFDIWIKANGIMRSCPKWIIDLFNKNHVDYNELIEQGLAYDINTLNQQQ